MTGRSAADLYNDLLSVIKKAVVDNNIYAVPAAAQQAGMQGGETERGVSQRWDYTFTDSLGHSVMVHCRWYDQSKPFSIHPDKHIITVELTGPQPQRYTDSYEE